MPVASLPHGWAARPSCFPGRPGPRRLCLPEPPPVAARMAGPVERRRPARPGEARCEGSPSCPGVRAWLEKSARHLPRGPLLLRSTRCSGGAPEGRPWQREGHPSSFRCPCPHNALPALSSADYSPADLMWAGRPAAKMRPLSRKRGVVFTPRPPKDMLSIR